MQVVGVYIQHHFPAGLGEHRVNIGDTLLTIALGKERHVLGSHRRGKEARAPVPGGVIGISQRTDRCDQRGEFHTLGQEFAQSRLRKHGGGYGTRRRAQEIAA